MPADSAEVIEEIIRRALAEDIGGGDITTDNIIPKDKMTSALFVARDPLVFCGFAVVKKLFSLLDKDCKLTSLIEEGEKVDSGQELISIEGRACTILTGERVALNLLQRMCGVATMTARYVEAIKETKAVILDTRKTMPGLRILDKYAVYCGGGKNHRKGLYDAVLIKDNHIALCGSVNEAVEKVRQSLYEKYKAEGKIKAGSTAIPCLIEVECDTLQQVEDVLKTDVDRILLDNMSVRQIAQAVYLADGEVSLEASGNITLENIEAIARTGVDFISVGCVTHSAPAADIGLDIAVSDDAA